MIPQSEASRSEKIVQDICSDHNGPRTRLLDDAIRTALQEAYQRGREDERKEIKKKTWYENYPSKEAL